MIEPKILQYKLQEPFLLLGKVSIPLKRTWNPVVFFINQPSKATYQFRF